jgi:hypothetical protein
MGSSPRAAAGALAALDLALAPPLHAVVVSEPGSAILAGIRRAWAPRLALVALRPGELSRLPFARGFKALEGKPTAYICSNFSCKLPTVELERALKLLAEAS